MRILIVEPYLAGSHADWAEGYRRHSRHEVDILGLAGSSWKWRMHGGAVTLARRFEEQRLRPDLVLATDMLDVTTFQALTRTETASLPFAVYFHENQLTYPWSPTDRDVVHRRDRHYGFINYSSALAADAVLFNSAYHRDAFLDELVRFLKHFPDHRELGSVEEIRAKSSVLPLGLDLGRFDGVAPTQDDGGSPVVLWNHRWEYDKNPEDFFAALDGLVEEGIEFRAAILGENFKQHPEVFDDARRRLGKRVVAFGYAEAFADYASWLHRSQVAPVTSYQDFFGASVVEAVYCGCRPLLPRRLAYPEVIPEEFHADLFYDDGEELPRRLSAVLRDPRPAPPELRRAMGRYDWSTLAPRYDDTLEDVRRRNRGKKTRRR